MFNSSQCQCWGDWWAGISDGSPEGRVRGPEEEKGELRRERWRALRCFACFAAVFSLGLSCLRCLLRSAHPHVASQQRCVLFAVFFPLSASFLAAFLVLYWSVPGFTSSRRKKEGAGNHGRKAKGKRKIVSSGGVRRRGEDLSQTTL